MGGTMKNEGHYTLFSQFPLVCDLCSQLKDIGSIVEGGNISNVMRHILVNGHCVLLRYFVQIKNPRGICMCCNLLDQPCM